MYRKPLRSLVVMLAFGLATGLALPTNASAQVATTGTITTIIEDAQGGRLPGVTVTASANDVVTTRTVVSDAEGVATLEALAPSAAYVIKASLSGFRDYSREAVLVSTGKTTTLHVQLTLQSVTEQVLVTGSTPVVDVTRAVSGQDITLQLTESLPTGRSYQSYLQLVPGVMPDSQNASGNPSSRSGMNWKDAGVATDNIGSSTDNQYYFEGINVTDPVTGTFGANLNTEIIQEQKVLTGGIPAEFVGSAGLISTVVTKSGSNTAHGSYNYFFQNNNLVAENDHNPGVTFSSHDTAFTVGGPVVRDKVWAFGSWRYTKRTEDVAAQDTHLLLRKPSTIQKQGFAKGTSDADDERPDQLYVPERSVPSAPARSIQQSPTAGIGSATRVATTTRARITGSGAVSSLMPGPTGTTAKLLTWPSSARRATPFRFSAPTCGHSPKNSWVDTVRISPKHVRPSRRADRCSIRSTGIASRAVSSGRSTRIIGT